MEPKRIVKYDQKIHVEELDIDCRYRYKLLLKWNPGNNYLMFLMMNPSRADFDQSDNTVAKCCRLAQRWGYDGLFVGNVCAYKSTDPANLLLAKNPRGILCHFYLHEMAYRSDKIIVAHGNLPRGLEHYAVAAVRHLIAMGHRNKLHYLKVNKSGCPGHPLYIPERVNPLPWHTDKRLEKIYIGLTDSSREVIRAHVWEKDLKCIN